jgi:hypothetical protein
MKADDTDDMNTSHWPSTSLHLGTGYPPNTRNILNVYQALNARHAPMCSAPTIQPTPTTHPRTQLPPRTHAPMHPCAEHPPRNNPATTAHHQHQHHHGPAAAAAATTGSGTLHPQARRYVFFFHSKRYQRITKTILDT